MKTVACIRNITLNVKNQDNRNNGAFPLVYGADEAVNNAYKLSQNAVAEMIEQHRKLMEFGDIKDLLDSGNGLAWEVLKIVCSRQRTDVFRYA